MTDSFSARAVARALRADVPLLEDDQLVVTLAQIARYAPVPTSRRPSLGLRLAAVTASVAVTLFGAAYGFDALFSQPEPAIGPSNGPASEGPQGPSGQDPRVPGESSGTESAPDDPHVRPSPTVVPEAEPQQQDQGEEPDQTTATTTGPEQTDDEAVTQDPEDTQDPENTQDPQDTEDTGSTSGPGPDSDSAADEPEPDEPEPDEVDEDQGGPESDAVRD